jgi:hypothetical protein
LWTKIASFEPLQKANFGFVSDNERIGCLKFRIVEIDWANGEILHKSLM